MNELNKNEKRKGLSKRMEHFKTQLSISCYGNTQLKNTKYLTRWWDWRENECLKEHRIYMSGPDAETRDGFE